MKRMAMRSAQAASLFISRETAPEIFSVVIFCSSTENFSAISL